MTRQTDPGVIEGPNLREGRVRYDVRLPDGTLLVVSRRLIVPEPAELLPPGTRLLVEHNGLSVIGALMAGLADRAGPQVQAPATPPPPRPARVTAPQAQPRARRPARSRFTGAPAGDVWPPGPAAHEEPPDWPDFLQYRESPPGAPAHPPDDDDGVPGEALSHPAETPAVPRPAGPESPFDPPILCPEMAPLFGAGGPVQQLLGERYRLRDGQLLMANLVRSALQERRHAVLEAGTGIGKSFAYLIPVIWSGAKAVVSTSNKALMSQLWRKDLPALAQIAPRPFTAALLKGRNNYLCVRRLEELGGSRRLPGLGGDIERIEEGLGRVPSGDVEEMGLATAVAQRFTVDHHACEGFKCPSYGNCFYERAKAVALDADIVVTNHALLCFSMLRFDNQTLPVRPVLIIDEAHELESYAINAQTQLLEYETLAAVVNHPLAAAAAENEARQQAMECNHGFFQEVLAQRPDRWSQRWALHGEIQQGLALWKWLKEIHGKLTTQRVAKDDQGKLESLVYFAEEILGTVRALSNPEPETAVRYCDLPEDAGARTDRLQAQYRPLEVAEELKRALFDAWPRVICTSATLGVDRNLGWFLRRVGLQADQSPANGALAQVIASPFDYRNQVLLYTPHGLTPAYGVGEAQYVDRLTEEVRRLVEASRGRAFVLCTSRKRMLELYTRLAPVLAYPCFCQGKEFTRREMLERFQASGEAVLFGTRSFWEGVDIPGEALSLVILDKVPFLPHNDPVLQRQERLIAARGGNPFEELQVSHAALTLRQGAGRLIRTETDRGVIALLDSRINTNTNYGPKIIRSLPGGRQTMKFESVQAFFARS